MIIITLMIDFSVFSNVFFICGHHVAPGIYPQQPVRTKADPGAVADIQAGWAQNRGQTLICDSKSGLFIGQG
jgi:hypothetical protein